MFFSQLGWAFVFAHLSHLICHAGALPAHDENSDNSKTLFFESLTTATLMWSSVETIPFTDSKATTASPTKIGTTTTTTATRVLKETVYRTISQIFTETAPCSTSYSPVTTFETISQPDSWTTVTVVASTTKVVSCSTCANSLRTIVSRKTETLSSLVPISTIAIPATTSVSNIWTTVTVVASTTKVVSCSSCVNSLHTVTRLTTETLSSLVPVSTISQSPRTSVSSLWTTTTLVSSATEVLSCSSCTQSLMTIIGLTTNTGTPLITESLIPIPTSTKSLVKTLSMAPEPSILKTLSNFPSSIFSQRVSHTSSTKTKPHALSGGTDSTARISSATKAISELQVTSITHVSSDPAATSTAQATLSSEDVAPILTLATYSRTSVAAVSTPMTSSNTFAVSASTSADGLSVTQVSSTSDSTPITWTSSVSLATSAMESSVSSDTSAPVGADSTLLTSTVHASSSTDSTFVSPASIRATGGSTTTDISATSTTRAVLYTITRSSSKYEFSSTVGSSSATNDIAVTTGTSLASIATLPETLQPESVSATSPMGSTVPVETTLATGASIQVHESATDVATSFGTTFTAESSQATETSSIARSMTSVKIITLTSSSQTSSQTKSVTQSEASSLQTHSPTLVGTLATSGGTTTKAFPVTESFVATRISTNLEASSIATSPIDTASSLEAGGSFTSLLDSATWLPSNPSTFPVVASNTEPTFTISTRSSSTFFTTKASLTSETPTSSTSKPTSTAAASSLFCAPTYGSDIHATGILKDQLSVNVTEFCETIDRKGKSSVGCDRQKHNGLLLSAGCHDGQFTTESLQFDYPDVTAWMKVSLVEGNSFIVNSTTCNKALSTVLKDCPLVKGIHNGLTIPIEFGGGFAVSDGAGGVANFTLSLIPPSTTIVTVISSTTASSTAISSSATKIMSTTTNTPINTTASITTSYSTATKIPAVQGETLPR